VFARLAPETQKALLSGPTGRILYDQTARVRQELDAVRAARRGDEVDGSKLERGPIVLDKPDDGDEKTIDSID